MIKEQYMLLSLVDGHREYSFLKHSTKKENAFKTYFSTLSKFETLHLR